MENRVNWLLNPLISGFFIFGVTSQRYTNIIIFESKIAPTVEGAYRTTGGGRQIIVPNIDKWTKPVKVYEFTIKK